MNKCCPYIYLVNEYSQFEEPIVPTFNSCYGGHFVSKYQDPMKTIQGILQEKQAIYAIQLLPFLVQ